MRRLVIFAHYDPDGLIADHVVYYLEHLASISKDILFASDCNISEGQLAKIKDLATVTSTSRHQGYDFGSWKKCLEHIDFNLSSWDELIVANDSCFAPLHSLEATFTLIGECDFWGATQEWYSYVKAELRKGHERHGSNRFVKKDTHDIWCDFPFLNSYFMVFRKIVMQDPAFLQFWRNIEPQANKIAVIEKYEMSLTKTLTSLNYKFKCLATRSGVIFYSKYHVKVPSSYQFPWLRVLLCKRNDERQPEINKCLDKINYPRHLIDGYMQRTLGTATPRHYFLAQEPTLWRYKRLVSFWLDNCAYMLKRLYMSALKSTKYQIINNNASETLAKEEKAPTHNTN